jgi:hypothetical protein
VGPGRRRAGSWKQSDFPQPGGLGLSDVGALLARFSAKGVEYVRDHQPLVGEEVVEPEAFLRDPGYGILDVHAHDRLTRAARAVD